MGKNIKEIIASYNDELVAIRRKLHKEPELSWQEFKTTQFVCDYLEQLNIPYRKTEPTGVIADITGGKQGKTVALRADMDALSVYELNRELEYHSQEDGKMHACGHDAHTAMLLIAAKALNEIKDELEGEVRLIFQPAEEVATGAKEMVRQRAVESVDNVFGIHIWSQIPSHKIQCAPGPSFASADLFKVIFKGRGGHAAMPHDTVDAVMIASSFALNVQTVVSRTVNPLRPAVLTIGKMEVGTRFNVIAENAVLEGTVRCFDVETRQHIEAQIHQYAEQIAAIYGGTAEVEYNYGTQAVINDKDSAELARQVIEQSFGEESYYLDDPTMGGEDFSFYLDKVPGCFALVGCGNAEKDSQWAHHHGRFNVDEDTLKVGSELFVQYAVNFLKRNN
ncbi:amidohydrolase [Viridibacillus sp. FSL H8-0123]|uniref:amidohydrolase n=1 Tax=Viridibacillus sp. FSL H8-0123 TaxID=1928922 RepID=UPI00096CAAB1|nr:amidohydrolase [Viridibacillus sp. FSL H8-0123]OMC81779.1 peptidase M20 [Viridibacillus sp. FSL H8-0123]